MENPPLLIRDIREIRGCISLVAAGRALPLREYSHSERFHAAGTLHSLINTRRGNLSRTLCLRKAEFLVDKSGESPTIPSAVKN
jgi:hypothetical protein